MSLLLQVFGVGTEQIKHFELMTKVIVINFPGIMNVSAKIFGNPIVVELKKKNK